MFELLKIYIINVGTCFRHRKAIANQNKIVLAAPYTDASLTGIIMTISKTVVAGR